MTNQKQILSTYRDIITMIKDNLTRDLIEANGAGNIDIPDLEIGRVTALTSTLIDLYASNGYELLVNQTKTNTTKSKKTK